MIHTFVPTHVGPSKLDLLLADAPPMTEENKEKVILIIDIARLGKLLGGPPMTPKVFYSAYDCPLHVLQHHQHDLQIEWNTKSYQSSVQGHDF